jgi:hypothetical protein
MRRRVMAMICCGEISRLASGRPRGEGLGRRVAWVRFKGAPALIGTAEDGLAAVAPRRRLRPPAPECQGPVHSLYERRSKMR